MVSEAYVRRWAWIGGLFPLGNLMAMSGTLDVDVVLPVQLAFITFPIVANVVLLATGIALKQRGLTGWSIGGLCLSVLAAVLGATMGLQLVARGSLSLISPMVLGVYLLMVDSIAIGFLARRAGSNLLFILAIGFTLVGLVRLGEVLFWVHPAAAASFSVSIAAAGRKAGFKARALEKKGRVLAGMITLGIVASAAVVPYLVVGTIGDLAHPRFIVSDFVEVAKIANISRFRSHAGHEYVDSFEGGERSMKHYFTPIASCANSSTCVEVYAPADAIVAAISWEGHEIASGELRGFHVDLMPSGAPLYKITIFHVNVTPGLVVGASVRAGQLIGHADTRYAHDFDIAIDLLLPFGTSRHVSYFAVMEDGAFVAYQARGITSRDQMIIPRAEADAAEGVSMPQSWDWVDLS
ncbi:MAG: hypothetical protein JW839_19315 [Candidatus Lokiarchaeota archaeon]|nr:hypothetical protein [Candidatus Lokiarchaeota archaeon]